MALKNKTIKLKITAFLNLSISEPSSVDLTSSVIILTFTPLSLHSKIACASLSLVIVKTQMSSVFMLVLSVLTKVASDSLEGKNKVLQMIGLLE